MMILLLKIMIHYFMIFIIQIHIQKHIDSWVSAVEPHSNVTGAAVLRQKGGHYPNTENAANSYDSRYDINTSK